MEVLALEEISQKLNLKKVHSLLFLVSDNKLWHVTRLTKFISACIYDDAPHEIVIKTINGNNMFSASDSLLKGFEPKLSLQDVMHIMEKQGMLKKQRTHNNMVTSYEILTP